MLPRNVQSDWTVLGCVALPPGLLGGDLLIQPLIRTCQGPKKELGRVSQLQKGRRESLLGKHTTKA